MAPNLEYSRRVRPGQKPFAFLIPLQPRNIVGQIHQAPEHKHAAVPGNVPDSLLAVPPVMHPGFLTLAKILIVLNKSFHPFPQGQELQFLPWYREQDLFRRIHNTAGGQYRLPADRFRKGLGQDFHRVFMAQRWKGLQGFNRLAARRVSRDPLGVQSQFQTLPRDMHHLFQILHDQFIGREKASYAGIGNLFCLFNNFTMDKDKGHFIQVIDIANILAAHKQPPKKYFVLNIKITLYKKREKRQIITNKLISRNKGNLNVIGRIHTQKCISPKVPPHCNAQKNVFQKSSLQCSPQKDMY